MIDSVTETLTPAALQILQVAERLYAEQGVDAVSVRQISREAGQKNHSAVQYHFGSARGLLEAILDFRMIPLNARRQRLLDHWESQENPDDIAGLVQTLVEPLTEELRRPVEDSYYISLLQQLSGQGRIQEVVREGSPRATSLRRAHAHINRVLAPLGETLALERQAMMGRLMLASFADWDRARRNASLTDAQLTEHSVALTDFIVGGLTAPIAQ